MKDSGNLWYICEFCFRAFLRVEDLDQHSEGDHEKLELTNTSLHSIALWAKLNNSARSINHPPVPAKTRTDKSALSSNHRKIKQKRHLCTYCHKSFSKRDFLTEHVRVHTGEKPYGCTQCTRSFSIRANLRRHIRSLHTNEKPFKCKNCKQCFANKTHLETHMRVHTGEKPHTCKFCVKSFITTTALARHTRIHTREKPFACFYCASRFRTDRDLAVHVVTHTREKAFSCGICTMAFTTNSAMRRHERIHASAPKSREDIQHELQEANRLDFPKNLQFARECYVRIVKSL